jgi:hypothetical protein
MKGNNDATDPDQDQAPAPPYNVGRAAHHQPQDSADMVPRITAAGDTQVRWLTREGLLDEPDLLVSLPRRKPGAGRGRFRAGAQTPGTGRSVRGHPRWQRNCRSFRFGVTREYPFVNLARRPLFVTVTVRPMAVAGESRPDCGIDGSIRSEPGTTGPPARHRSLYSMPGYRDLGRYPGNHLREPPCKPSQAL